MPASRSQARATTRQARQEKVGAGDTATSSQHHQREQGRKQPAAHTPCNQSAAARTPRRSCGTSPPASSRVTCHHTARGAAAGTAARLVQFAAGGAADLAAGGLEHDAPGGEHHVVGGQAEHADHGLLHRLAQGVVRPTLASAATTSRSVPLAGSGLPKTATQPARMPGTRPTASSTSCG